LPTTPEGNHAAPVCEKKAGQTGCEPRLFADGAIKVSRPSVAEESERTLEAGVRNAERSEKSFLGYFFGRAKK
jgi:hypothetical protein